MLQLPSTSSVALGLLTMQVLEVSQDWKNLWRGVKNDIVFKFYFFVVAIIYSTGLLGYLILTWLFLVVFNTMLAQSEGTHQVIEFSELKFAQNQRRSDQSDKLSTSNLFNPQNSIFKNMKTPKNWKNGSCSETLKVYLGYTFFGMWVMNYLCMSHKILDRTLVYFTKYFLYAFRSVSSCDN